MPRSAEQTEELANAATHGLGCMLALAAWPALAGTPATAHPTALGAGYGLTQLGSSVFVLTMLLMFLVSAAYHAAPVGATRQRLRRLDHALIFIFIAGSCTPFVIGPGAGGLDPISAGASGAGAVWPGAISPAVLTPAGAWHSGTGWPATPWLTLAAVWLVALAGMLLKLANRLRRPLLSTGLYLVFGWLAAAAAWPALIQLNNTALGLVVGGGLAYSLGSAFYLLGHRMRWAHLVWHVFVLLGCACHFLALWVSGR